MMMLPGMDFFGRLLSAALLGQMSVTAQHMTCGDVKDVYRSNACCGDKKDMAVESPLARGVDPPIPGVLGGTSKAHVLLGMAPDYPPYTAWADTTPTDLSGFNKEFADLMEPICGVKVDMILAPWSDCWTSKPDSVYFSRVTEYVGSGIFKGFVHGCTAYTHTKGERGFSLEFTDAILKDLKSAGILTRLENGVPVVSPTLTDYTGVKLGDVTGWAPTADTFSFLSNSCAAGTPKFVKTDAIMQTPDGNGPAIAQLLDGTIDALYIYADQIAQFQASNDPELSKLANGFGTTFAFIQVGMRDWTVNGTTLAISKRGSGLKNVLNPCIQKVIQTKNYTEVCKKWMTLTPEYCFPNAASGASSGTATLQTYDVSMGSRTDSKTCADGYCKCSER